MGEETLFSNESKINQCEMNFMYRIYVEKINKTELIIKIMKHCKVYDLFSM